MSGQPPQDDGRDDLREIRALLAGIKARLTIVMIVAVLFGLALLTVLARVSEVRTALR